MNASIQTGLPNALPGFDLASASARLGHNKALLGLLLKRFPVEYASLGDKIESLIAEGCGEKAAFLLHKIQGAAATIGAEQLAQCARELEGEVENWQPPPSLANFLLQLKNTVDAIARYESE